MTATVRLRSAEFAALEAGQARHLVVEHGHTRPVRFDLPSAVFAVVSFGQDFEARVGFDDLAQPGAQQRMVVGNHEANLCGHCKARLIRFSVFHQPDGQRHGRALTGIEINGVHAAEALRRVPQCPSTRSALLVARRKALTVVVNETVTLCAARLMTTPGRVRGGMLDDVGQALCTMRRD